VFGVVRNLSVRAGCVCCSMNRSISCLDCSLKLHMFGWPVIRWHVQKCQIACCVTCVSSSPSVYELFKTKLIFLFLQKKNQNRHWTNNGTKSPTVQDQVMYPAPMPFQFVGSTHLSLSLHPDALPGRAFAWLVRAYG
jgi:hypothetical protein